MSSRDLLIAVPSRGRPGSVRRLIAACQRTCRADTQLEFAFDECDPELEANLAAAGPEVSVTVGPRKPLAEWTNELVLRRGSEFTAYASLGDDHVPRTDGWDTELLKTLTERGPGLVYPNDLRRPDVPEAVVMDARIVEALGWMCEPTVSHYYTDNVWRDLGSGAGCLWYREDVIVEHLHPTRGNAVPDQTYVEAARGLNSDLAAYQRWRRKRMGAGIESVRSVRAAAADPLGHR